MTFALLGSTWTGAVATGTVSSSDNGGPVDTTGAKLIIFSVSHHKDATPTVVDSEGNSYTLATIIIGAETATSVYYCINPVTDATHTWNLSGTAIYAVGHIAYFSNTHTVTGPDVQSGASASASSLAAGSVTPTLSHSLVVAACTAGGTGGSFSIDGGFTIPTAGQHGGVAFTSYSGAHAYLIQTSIAAANPTWTMPVSGNCTAKTVVFNGSDGSGGDTTPPVLTSPVGTTTGSTTATIGATTDEGNGTMYGVVTTSNTQPSVAQIAAGQDHTGSAAAFGGSVAVSSTGAKTINATGLAPSTAYYAHLYHDDAAGNDSNRVTSSQFTTDASSGGSTLLLKMIQMHA